VGDATWQVRETAGGDLEGVLPTGDGVAACQDVQGLVDVDVAVKRHGIAARRAAVDQREPATGHLGAGEQRTARRRQRPTGARRDVGTVDGHVVAHGS
jgi:hypothetical protein